MLLGFHHLSTLRVGTQILDGTGVPELQPAHKLLRRTTRLTRHLHGNALGHRFPCPARLLPEYFRFLVPRGPTTEHLPNEQA